MLVDRSGPAPVGLDAELYCFGSEGCDDFPPDLPGRTSHLGAGADARMAGRCSSMSRADRWAQYYGEDSILVQDGFDESTRFRLLYANGTELDAPRRERPGPGCPRP